MSPLPLEQPATPGPAIFISAAEPSADLYGAGLIQAVKSRRPDVRFVGMAGPRMRAQGCETLFDMTAHAAMLTGVLRVVRQGAKLLRTARHQLRSGTFDAAVVIDSPTLHLRLAGSAKTAGVPVLYYVAPQLWAWGARRISKLRNRVDRMAVILPFEEGYFRDRGVDATYVGHPLADALAEQAVDEEAVRDIRKFGNPIVALLPGSRRHVVAEVLPGQLEVAERISSVLPGAAFGVSVAGGQVAPIIQSQIHQCRVPVKAYFDRHTALIRAADLVLVASGTTTLEVAFHGRPMIVMYNTSRLFYHAVGRWMIRTPYLCLPNILAGKEVVPEFMPYYSSTKPIADKAIELLRSEQLRRNMVERLTELVEPMRASGAAQRTAEMLLEMID